MIDLLALLDRIPATFLGIMIGSLFTIIGVLLTNASNTKRLRIQHEHERNLANKTRALNLRRDVYMAAMEAISTGMVAVSRFGDAATPYQQLMQSYTDRSPAISQVTIVGSDKTIEAVATFNQELTGTFLRLSSKREQLAALERRMTSLAQEIERSEQEQAQLLHLMQMNQTASVEDATENSDTELGNREERYARVRRHIEMLRAEETAIEEQLYARQIELVQQSVREVSALDRLLIPVISLMRAELELPFNEQFYTRLLEIGHKKQAEFLEAFFQEQAGDMEAATVETANARSQAA